MGRGHRQRRQGLIAPSVPGALAQLVAHLLCKQGVRGSSPLGSTTTSRRRPVAPADRRAVVRHRPRGCRSSGCAEVPRPATCDGHASRTARGSPAPRRTTARARSRAAAVLPCVPAAATDADGHRPRRGTPPARRSRTSTSAGPDERPGGVLAARRGRRGRRSSRGDCSATDNSELMLDHGFTEDDVDWEAHFTGDAAAAASCSRSAPDLDMDAVAGAVRAGVGPLAGGDGAARPSTSCSPGVAADGAASWATDAGARGAGRRARGGDVRPARLRALPGRARPRRDRRGPGGGARPAGRARAGRPATASRCPSTTTSRRSGWARTARTSSTGSTSVTGGRPPTVAAFGDGFVRGVGDPGTGRIGYAVPRPPLAARLVLTEHLPFGVCNDVTPIAEPTGL